MLKNFALFISILLSNTAFSQNIKSVADYENLIKHYRYLKPDSAVYLSQKALNFARSKGDSNGVATILLQQGMIDDNNGKFEDSEKKYQHSLEIFNSLNFKKGIASSLIRIGVVKLRNGNYDKAIGDFLSALKNSESIKDNFGLMEANYNISWAYLDQNKFALALQYLKTAESYNLKIPFSNISLNIYNHFGVIYSYYNDFKTAEYYLRKGLQLSQKPEYQGLNINLLNNLAGVYSKQGLTGQAIKLQEEALARSRKIGNYLRELQSLLALSKTYTNTDPKKAISYLNQAVLLARAKEVPRQEIRFLQSLSNLYKSQGQYKEALETKDRQYVLADSFFYKKMSQNIEKLKTEYELSKSNARIKELSYINNRRQLELKNSVLYRNITLAGISVLLIILVLLYKQNQLKNKSNQEINRKNASLKKLLEEKEWLVKEVHHRVKNNLQIVVSLLDTQAKYLNNKEAIEAIDESAHRMQAMSLIHQKLYQGEDASIVNMEAYLGELTDYLKDSFSQSKNIQFKKLFDPLELDIVQAIPLGLIVNEAVTNSIKHAFDGNENNSICVALSGMENEHIILEIYDNGKGLPPDFNLETCNSMGIHLIKGLAQQIEGALTFENKGGLYIKVDFVADTNLTFSSRKEVFGEFLTQ
ncbi:tetratricopeptide repeat protein [Pedobacter sp. HMF7647]|uniref:histidine kinase n=1 Tax=Hufsiella arboris TaxID=2695275 RepID=A0A7K1Y697_9SPHI|nr:sensor histidine kinase [Hufsiella arboris]MXV50104.1 tetratricopeptide repeat protein [Hufsiella arboris]